jgi:ribosomal protein S18 acetylase RimI-like enzyme
MMMWIFVMIPAVRAAYDAQIRCLTEPDEPGARVEAVRHGTGPAGMVVRCLCPPGRGPSRVTWSELDEDCADAAIAAQLAFFRARGEAVEWKLHDYDQPADLGARLAAAGLSPGEEELVMVAETAAVAAGPAGRPDLPDGVALAEVTGEAGIAMLTGVHDRVFGGDHSQLRDTLAATLAAWPGSVAMVVALAGGEPVSAARAEFLPGRDFAGLWGGGTLPAFRGRGLYRALTGYRARLAAARGYRYLQVDALPASQPILARLGFAALARTTPYTWQPPAGGRSWSS